MTDPTAAAILKQIESLATLLRSFRRNEVVELDAVPAGDELPSLNIVANLIKPIPSHPRDVIVGIDPAVGPDGVLQREHHAGRKMVVRTVDDHRTRRRQGRQEISNISTRSAVDRVSAAVAEGQIVVEGDQDNVGEMFAEACG